MSLHIGAKKGEIADRVLLPGDPLRAKAIADEYLSDVVCYNEIRGMLGFTGSYNGKRVSVQGSGMGIPSLSIYVHELLVDYNVKQVIRVGTCGAIQEHLKIGDIIFGIAASTHSSTNSLRFPDGTYAPAADFKLLHDAYDVALKMGVEPIVGNVFSSDLFYHDDMDHWKKWANYGVLALEMESSGLYTLAAKYKAQALTINTVSDHLLTGEQAPPDERQSRFMDMAKIALEV
jgi:purine-nucleoside phosphorylase